MKLLNVGDKIPQFECYDDSGNIFTAVSYTHLRDNETRNDSV